MPSPTDNLSSTAIALLQAAAARTDRIALRPDKTPLAAARQVVRSLVNKLMLSETISAVDGAAWWEHPDHAQGNAVRITDHGMRTIGVEPAKESEHRKNVPLRKATLRHAAAAALDAYASADERRLELAMDDLAAVLDLGNQAARLTTSQPRTGTKNERVIAMLTDGATAQQIMDETGWNSNTTRGWLSALRKKGVALASSIERGEDGKRLANTTYRIQVRLADGGLAGEQLPSADCDVDILWRDFHR